MRIQVDGHLDLRVLPNGRWCELLSELKVRVGSVVTVIPKGFQTDFGSVMKIFWSIVSPMGLHTIAAVTHDYLYSTGDVSRLNADKIFYQLMCFYGVGFFKAKLMYCMVRWFGWSHYTHD